MSESEKPSVDTKPATPKRNTRGKLLFLGALLAAAVGIFLLQQRGLSLSGWGSDLDAALQQAQTENRPIVVMFLRNPPSETARQTKTVIGRPENQKALQDGKFIPVLVETRLDSDLCKKYSITRLPTLMVLLPNGAERNRYEGIDHIGEIPFRQVFLDYQPSPEQP